MHVALMATNQWLNEDLSTFDHLVVGLIDEQIRVTQVLPEGFHANGPSTIGDRLTWRDSSWPRVRRWRLLGLHDQLEDLKIDLIYALDGGVWQGAVDLAKRLQIPVMLAASSSADLGYLDRLRSVRDGGVVIYTGATDPIVAAIREKTGEQESACLIRPGVYASEELTPHRADKTGAYCGVVSGNGVYDADYDALLLGLRSIVSKNPNTQFFFDSHGQDQHSLWQWAKRYDLLSNISIVPDRLGHREILLRADVLIHPQALHRSRILTLQAMSCGVPVIALYDEWLDYLVDQETAWVLAQSTPDDWVESIERVMGRHDETGRILRAAQQWVRERHRASFQVGLVIKTCRRLIGEAIKFPVD